LEFEGSCPQDAVGLVVLKGLSLSASTRENQYFHTRVSVGNTAVLISKIDILAASL
jgi:hypothetical protein